VHIIIKKHNEIKRASSRQIITMRRRTHVSQGKEELGLGSLMNKELRRAETSHLLEKSRCILASFSRLHRGVFGYGRCQDLQLEQELCTCLFLETIWLAFRELYCCYESHRCSELMAKICLA